MAAAVILAIMLSFILVGISSSLFPDQKSPTKVIPDQEPLLNKMLWAFQYISVIALTSIVVVGAGILTNRIISKKKPKHTLKKV